MKITLFIGGLYGGGAERVMCNLANFLFRKGHEVDILTMSESKKHYTLEKGIHNSILLEDSERRNKLSDSFKRYFRLKRYIKREKTDCYVVMLPITTILLLLLTNNKTAPVIVSERADPSKYSRIIQFLLKKLAHRARKFVFQTETVKEWYNGFVKESLVIPNAINEQFIREKYSGEREKTIVAAGRLTEQKNFKMLISAFSSIAKDFPEYKLVIYGKGPKEKELFELAESLEIGDRVFFPGQIDNMPDVLEKASLFVLSSNYEGMPNVLMEAMALGVPCVSTDCGGGGARYLIEDGINGRLVPVNDRDALILSMKELLNNKETADFYGSNAHKIVYKLNPEYIYNMWESSIVDTIIANNRKAN